MKILASVIAGLAVLCSGSEAAAAKLWQQTSTGMTPQQLRHAYPNASGVVLVDGKEMMTLHPVDLFDVPFRALFYFSDHRLTEVDLVASSDDPSVFAKEPAAVAMTLIRDELTKRYGSAVLSTPSKASFLSDGTSIELGFSDTEALLGKGQGYQIVTIAYKGADNSENPL